MNYLLILIITTLMTTSIFAQDKLLTMEEAVLSYHLTPKNKNIQWQGNKDVFTYIDSLNLVGESAINGKSKIILTLKELNSILKCDLKGWSNYSWKNDKTIVINRAGYLYEIDVDVKKITKQYKLPRGAQNLKQNTKGVFAYTKGNNLYIMKQDSVEIAVAENKNKNIVNGQFVSRNEFGISGGIFWSPNGELLAFYSKDESKVGTFPLVDINTRTGSLREIKYPMAGMSSEKIKLGIYNVATTKTVFLKVSDFDDERYLTNITWGPKGKLIYVQVLNRAQKHMRLNVYDAMTGEFVKNILEEKNDKYVEPLHSLVFIKGDDNKFIYTSSNIDGYQNLYFVDTNTGDIKRFTETDADVEYVGQDKDYIYYTSAEVNPVDNHLFKKHVSNGKIMQLTKISAWHNTILSGSKKYFIDNYSNLSTPRVIDVVRTKDAKRIKNILTANNPMKEYTCGEISLGKIVSADSEFQNYYRLIKPINFDASKKYPTIVYVYGGPHSQMVQNTWQASLRMWEMYMAQRGYVVYVMDNRGTQNRGDKFEKAIHGQCGQAEMADQMKGIEFLKSLPYVDENRIGVHGWSYGGFMTISLMTNHSDVFKVGVAGGPVIDWKWYEIMYGERYMDSPLTNQNGYTKTSLLNKAKDLKGKLLICQGAIDNVVLWQHSLNFIRECVVNQVQVDYFPYPRALHNVTGRDRIHLMQKVTDYFDDFLR